MPVIYNMTATYELPQIGARTFLINLKIKIACHLYYFFMNEKCTIIFKKANAICKYFDM